MTDRTMPDAHPLRSGDPTRLSGYEILGRLGEGGQGAVFLARREGREDAAGVADHVAIKLLHAGLTSDASARARFVRELEVAKRVARFCTAQVLDADVAGDQPYIISEYVPGRALNLVVRDEGPRTGGALERLAISTLTALMAIHQAGIVHRDFKPHNVMMGPDGPRVIDFGVARALGAVGDTQNVGTPTYMAPEHFTGGEVGPASDMFAWGTTMAFAANGRPAFGNDEMASVMHRILTGEPDLGDLPSPLRDLVLACLDKEPAERPTAREAQERLVDGSTGGPPAAQPDDEPDDEQEAPLLPPLPTFQGGGAPAPGAVPVMPMPLGGATDPGAQPGGVLPPDGFPAADEARQVGSAPTVSDARHVGIAPVASGVPEQTAPQPAPYADITPHPNGPTPYPGPGPNGLGTAPPGPPGGPHSRRGHKSARTKLVPVIAAVAVLAVVGAGSAWAATRSGDGGNEGRGTSANSASDDGAAEGIPGGGALGGSGAASTPGGPANKNPKKPPGQPGGQQSPGKSPGQQPGPGQSPQQPGQPQAPAPGGRPGGGGGGGGGGAPAPEPANKYSPQSVCNSGGHGSGYYVQRSVSGSGGKAYLLYNSSGYNCAVTLKTKNVGKSSSVSVWIQRQGGSQVKDGGSFAWYAGPVYVSAAKKCVRFGGDGATAPYGNCG